MEKANAVTESLKVEIEQLGEQYNKLSDEDLFTVWFMRAFLTPDNNVAADSLVNVSNDKDNDAILIDDARKAIFVVQTKYHKKFNSYNEKRSDVISFADLSHIYADKDNSYYKEVSKTVAPLVKERIEAARQRICRRGYRLWLYYVTTGKCSSKIISECTKKIQRLSREIRFEVISGHRIELLIKDYLDGVAPPIPTLDLEMEKGAGVEVRGIMLRRDIRRKIESWVFTMKGDAVGELYNIGGVRLFARNIRGFLGDKTAVNEGMQVTLKDEPDKFFYYNNGITIVCDDAEQRRKNGRDILQVSNPQVINGQQTTRTLAEFSKKASNASVLVKVIKIPRKIKNGSDGFDAMVSAIVRGTNWQNAIKQSDLIANDRTQIDLEREFRKLNYFYIRKRQTKGEARRLAGNAYTRFIKKDDLARAVAGCDLDPVVARSGVENLFDEEMYPHVFPTIDPEYYLTRYWLMMEVTYCAKGYPERGYAKWMVLNFLWSQLSPFVKSAKSKEKFRVSCEKQDYKLVNPLNRAINKVFIASLKYYRLNRGTGSKAIDVSNFFRNKKGRDKEFKKFWNSQKNISKKSFNALWKKVKQATR